MRSRQNKKPRALMMVSRPTNELTKIAATQNPVSSRNSKKLSLESFKNLPKPVGDAPFASAIVEERRRGERRAIGASEEMDCDVARRDAVLVTCLNFHRKPKIN